MPDGEEMFKLHGYSGPCPKPPLPLTTPTAGPRESGADKIPDGLKPWTVFDRAGLPSVEVCDYIHAVNIIRALQSLLTTTQRELAEARGRVKDRNLEAAWDRIKDERDGHKWSVGDAFTYREFFSLGWRTALAPTPAPPAKEGESP
jgi:hypothetical protein